MDFFSIQDQAKSSTRKLLVLFFLAIIAIIVVLYIATVHLFIPPQGFEGPTELHVINFFNHVNLKPPPGMSLEEWLLYRTWWYPRLFVGMAVIITALILGGTLYKTGRLNQGGRTIATMLGGRLLLPDLADAQERRLLNIVEEMAIAAGTPVPAVYLLEQEPGINAFAAGFSQKDMVIGVTKGCLVLLSRDELQGVVAHEFSHILRGDMRLNMRLMGTVFGITMISMIGYFILRFSTTGIRFGGGGSGSGKKRGKGGGGSGAGILVFGALLYVLGYLGVFFGNLIKSAIARQREFLADASAVQFTRNPAGLAGALKKIGGLSQGSRILSPRAHEASHFYFSNGLRKSFFRFLATHPPLLERIRRLDPSFTGEFPKIEAPEIPASAAAETAPVSFVAEAPPSFRKTEPLTVNPQQVVANIGILTADQIDYAANLRKGLPEPLLAALREPAGACAVVLSLLLPEEESARVLQLQKLRQNIPPAVYDAIVKLAPAVVALGREMRIPLADWAIPALRNLSGKQYDAFLALTEYLVNADNQINLFEFCIQRILRKNLDAHFHGARPSSVKYHKTEDILPDTLGLLSALAWTGNQSETDAAKAFLDGVRQLNLSERKEFALSPRPESLDLKSLDQALNRILQAGPYVRKNVLFSCAHVAASDGKLYPAERELLRAIADSLELPVPPFIRELAS